MSVQQLLQLCRNNDRRAQKQLYERYAKQLFGVCIRYVRNEADAEEVLLNAFYKIMTNLNRFEEKNTGTFEGWMYRIAVNEALMFLRSKQSSDWQRIFELDAQYDIPHEIYTDTQLLENDIIQLLDFLPTGYRTVFNLYAIEGYQHKEIAEILNVSINTSKSQLIKARAMLRKLLAKLNYPMSFDDDSAYREQE